MNNLSSQRTARLAVLQVLRLLFEDAAESVPMDPAEYLADMYCLWRAMAVATLPLSQDETETEQEDTVRSQIAELDEASLDDTEHALTAYEKMLELDPAEARAHRGLERLYAVRERWNDLEGLLGGRVALASARYRDDSWARFCS